MISRVSIRDGTYDIKFEDGERKSGVKRSQIKKRSGSSRKSSGFQIGEKVEAKVRGWTKFYPGTVSKVHGDGKYDIRFDDGERKSGVLESQMQKLSSSSSGSSRPSGRPSRPSGRPNPYGRR